MKKNALYTLIGICLISCSSTRPRNQEGNQERMLLPLGTCEGLTTSLRVDMDRYQAAVDAASKIYQDEEWKVETADPAASQDRLSKAFQVVQEKSYDKALLSQVVALAEASKEIDPKSCPIKRDFIRAKQILETSILTNDAVIELEKKNQERQDALQNKSNAYRISLPGEKEAVSKPLYYKKLGSTANREEREKLYKSFNGGRAKEWLNWEFRDLIKARNDEGRAAGFKNYYNYKFFRSQLDLKNYRAMVHEVKSKLSPKVKKLLVQMAKKEKISKIEGWDFRYLREKSSSGELNDLLKEVPEGKALELAKRFYSALGIDVDSYHFMMDLYPRAGKNTHAFAMGVIPPHVNDKGELLSEPKPDIRFLANLKKPVKWDDVSTIIHELGHAIHFGEIRQPLAIFRGFGSVETEAIAMTTERMAGSIEFMERELAPLVGASLEKMKTLLKKHLETSRIEQAIVLLRQVNFSDFEYEMYQNPDQDLAVLWSKMNHEYWGIKIAPEYCDWDIDHFVMAPVYVENYAIGILMVEQLMQTIERDFKTTYNSIALGDRLKKMYFAPGMQYDYLELIRQFTGKPLTAEAALKLVP